MRFLRTASTARLLAAVAAALVAVAAGAAIAVAAVGTGPVPARSTLPRAVHGALTAPAVSGVSANITFTDNLIDSTDFTGQASDPLLQGASGRLWAGDGRLRIELQSGGGDAQIVVDPGAFWISDPAQNTVYEGTLPAMSGHGTTGDHGVPTVAMIEQALGRLTRAVDVSGAQPADVAGRPAYRVAISPKGSGGLLGSAQLAFDALRGVPLSFDLYARGSSQPVLGLTATHIAYGAVPASDFAIAPPAGAQVMHLGTLAAPAPSSAAHRHAAAVTGVHPVADALAFTLRAPASLAGLPRTGVRLLGPDAALVAYGHGPGAIAVIESAAHGHAGSAPAPSSSGGLSLPTRQIAGATATVLSTPLGTVLHLTRGGVAFTVVGSVTGATAQSAAAGLF